MFRRIKALAIFSSAPRRWSVPSVRICFSFELVNERRGLTQPFEPLLGGEPIEFGVAVEILGRALGKCSSNSSDG